MTLANSHLQPFHVFKAETTKVNELYWKTSYCYTRTAALLETIATTGRVDTDPRVDHLWPSIIDGERRHATVKFSVFRDALDENLATLRRTSVLYLCSAFENALSAYYVLCCLYRPTALDSAWTHGACPALVGDSVHLADLLNKAKEAVGPKPQKAKLKGKYSTRMDLMERAFALGLDRTKIPSTDLDAHYETRHLIAHDQGIDGADEPTLSANEILGRRVSVGVDDWKRMIKDFTQTTTEIDRAVRAAVVTDCGIALAVKTFLERLDATGTKPTIGHLTNMVATEWRVEATYADITAALTHLGRTTTAVRAVHRRTVI